MKEKLTRNIGLKILSIILAAILWLVITNVDDPITPKSFTNVPVKILNTDAIDAISTKDMVYEIVEGATIDFTVAARRSIADNLVVSNFEVTADFAKLSDVNAVTIDIKCPRYGDDVAVTEGLYQVMQINLEELINKNFKVTVVSKGEPAEGYFVGEKSASTIITVSGPKSKIERIKEVVAEVNVAGASESYSSYEKLRAFDEEGDEIISNLTFSQSYASININIYETKEIDIKVKAIGDPAKGYAIANVDYEPKSIEVAGENDIFSSISELLIEEDVTGAKENIQKGINLQDQLGEGLLLVGDDDMAVINITVEKAESKEITIWPGDLNVKNMPADMQMTLLTTGPINLEVVGPADELKEISRNSLKPYIDLKDYTYGTYFVKIQTDAGRYSSLADNANVNVVLTSKDRGDQ
jgi:YbbR domain-containing protein